MSAIVLWDSFCGYVQNHGLVTMVPFWPTATKRVPFQATPLRPVGAGVTSVQVAPSSSL